MKPAAAGDRIHRIKTKVIAQFKRNFPTIPDGGITSFPISTRLSQKEGGLDHMQLVPNGVPLVDPGCCCTPLTDITVDFTVSNPPPSYTNPFGWDLTWTPAGQYTADASGQNVSEYIFTQTGDNTGTLFVNYDPERPDPDTGVIITLTGVGGCVGGTTTVFYCFLAGSPVTMADGSTRAIEDVSVGDVVLGAFGEHNPVLALHYSELGSGTMMNVNGEHHSTSNHPHITADKQFFCMYPERTSTQTYGREHTVINGDGVQERRVLQGLRSDRLKKLELGLSLKTLEGSRTLTSLKEYTLPPETKLYNLVVGGSHTYHVDGYAVTGWPREDDFDYDTWAPNTA